MAMISERKAGPATPLQVARYGALAATIREAMERLDITPREINVALGKPKAAPGIYHWRAGKGAPDDPTRAKLAKILHVEPAALARQDSSPQGRGGDRHSAAVRAPLALTGPATTTQGKAADVLAFHVNAEGIARIRLDVSMPVAQAMPLVRMLLDAGLVLGKGEDA